MRARTILSTLPIVLGSAVACSAPVERTVVYDARFGDVTSMDVYSPAVSPTERRPAIMIVHGGAWRSGSKSDFRSVARTFARAGYVAASVDYRLIPAGRFPAAAQDVGCALAYLENHADELGIDPTRIALLGYSAGAHLVSLVAVANDDPTIAPDCAEGTPSKPAGVIDGAGPEALMDIDSPLVRDFLGGTPDQMPDAYAVASPITHVTADDPPFLMFHGTLDTVVPVEQSEQMRDALRGAGVEANLMLFHGSGHVLNTVGDSAEVWKSLLIDTPEVWITVSDFLERTIGKP